MDRAAASTATSTSAASSNPEPLASGACTVLVVGAEGDFVEPSLLVTTSSGAQYAFEVPEAYSRLALEHRARPGSKLKACFVTERSARAVGGLTGLILRLAADGHARLVVAGPNGTAAEVCAAQKCARWVHPEVHGVNLRSNTRRCGGIGCYADEAVTVWPLFLDDDCECLVCEWEEHRRNKAVSSEEDGSDDGKGVDGSDHARCTSTDVRSAAQTICVGYVCELKDTADSLGVRILIMNAKSLDHVPRLSSIPTLRCFSTKACHAIDAVFHCTPTDVASTPTYQSWAESLSCEHFFCRSCDELGFRASARMSLRLNTVDSDAFPIPKALHGSRNGGLTGRFEVLGLCASIRVCKNESKKCKLDAQTLRPDDLQPDAVLNELKMLRPDLTTSSQATLERIKRDEVADLKDPNDETSQDVALALKSRLMRGLIGMKRKTSEFDPEIIFLGTGSAEPSKYRGSSGILVELPHPTVSHGKSWLMLDCGEGTVGSIARMFGREVMMSIVQSLKMVWISHHHADHMLGVRGVLDVHSQTCEAPLTLVGPTILREWLEICGVSKSSYRFIRSRDLFAGPFGRLPPPPPPPMQPKSQPRSVVNAHQSMPSGPNSNRGSLSSIETTLIQLTGLSRIEAVPVEHCRDAAALIIGSPSNWSLAYSGDCRPSRAFARAARGCDVMIHEATFENELYNHAVRKRHSTTSEALEIAADAQVKHIVLTHFSQRYPKAINLDSLSIEPIIAFDGFRVLRSQLDRMKHLQPTIARVTSLGSETRSEVDM